MLNQITLWKGIPNTVEHVKGFIDETALRMAHLDPIKDAVLFGKYQKRMEVAQKSLIAFRELRQVLNEC